MRGLAAYNTAMTKLLDGIVGQLSADPPVRKGLLRLLKEITDYACSKKAAEPSESK